MRKWLQKYKKKMKRKTFYGLFCPNYHFFTHKYLSTNKLRSNK